jgi:FAD/FMN-containing dehydrogenase
VSSVRTFHEDVRSALGGRHVVTDQDLTASHCIDWTRRWHGSTPAVLRPGSTDEVAEVVSAARRHHVALVPQGGNTGLVGGATPLAGEVVVDLRRLDRLDPVDAAARQVTVGAGVPLATVHAHVAPASLAFAVDLGAREQATVGGMVATNAGGIHVVRNGPMRVQLVGVEAVLGTGQVLVANMAGLEKDNTGYDLPALLCGSEGTLGIITAARLRLVARPEMVAAALVGFDSVDDAVWAASTLRGEPAVVAIELMTADGLAVVADFLQQSVPLLPVPAAVLLVEAAGRGDVTAALGDAVAALPGALDAAVSDDAAGRERLWRWREGHHEAAAALGVVHKADVTLPTGALARFVMAAPALVERVAPGSTTLVYGHAGDGNVHVNVVGPKPDDDSVVDAVLAAVLERGGSVSAEHGIGVAKRAWLVRQRGEVAVTAMRGIKSALDPDNICNPGVLLP